MSACRFARGSERCGARTPTSSRSSDPTPSTWRARAATAPDRRGASRQRATAPITRRINSRGALGPNAAYGDWLKSGFCEPACASPHVSRLQFCANGTQFNHAPTAAPSGSPRPSAPPSLSPMPPLPPTPGAARAPAGGGAVAARGQGGGGGAGGAGVEWGVQAALAASRCALAAAAAALAFAAACCCLCRCLGLLYAKLLRLLQLRCSPTATSFFHSQKVVLKNTGLLSSAAHAQCSLSNQNDCSRCAGALFASAGSSE